MAKKPLNILRPEIIKGTLTSDYKHFGFRNRSTRCVIYNRDVSSDIEYAFSDSVDAVFSRISNDDDVDIMDSITGISLRALPGTVSDFEIRVEFGLS